MATWYEVKMVRDCPNDPRPVVGWLAVASDGTHFFWQRDKHDTCTPGCCRFASFAEAERALEAFDSERGPTGRLFYEIQFPTRRVNGRKRPLLKSDATIVKSA